MHAPLKIITLLFCLTLLIACEEKKGAVPVSESPMTFKEFTVKDSTEVMSDEGDRTRIEVNWLEVHLADSTVSNHINTSINNNLLEAIASVTTPEGDASVKFPAVIKEAAQIFLDSYREVALDFGESTAWYFDAACDTAYISDSILSFVLTTDVFTGGAHGYHGNYFLHYDRKTGRELEIMNYVADTVALSKALEQAFRDQKELGEKQSLVDGGLFEDFSGRFPLSKEMVFSKEGLVAIYNAYDISPYSEGTVIIEVMDAQLLPALKGNHKP